MDSLNSLDELLDFDEDDDAKPSGGPPSGVPGPDDPGPPLPKTEEACEEEELEWLSNKDAFPAVEMETFVGIDILTGGIGNAKHQSPVSVLESSTTTTTSTIPTLMSSCGTLKAPHRARSKGRPRRGNSSFAGILGQQLLWNQGSSKDEGTKCETTKEEKKCQHCGATETPLWRQGPLGPKTLCNACGMRHRSGRLVPEYRPLRSPTFSRNVHSNFHKKIVEMKKKHHGKEMVVKPVDKG